MYTPSNNSIVQATLYGVMNNQTWMNVIHFLPVDPPAGDIADGEDVLDEFAGLLDATGAGWSFLRAVYTSNQMSIDYLQLQFIWPQRYAYKRYDADTQVGTQAGDQAPQNVDGVITFQSDLTGPHSQGGIRIPGLVATDVANGFVDGVIRGHMDSEAAFLTAATTVTAAGFDYQLGIARKDNLALSEDVTHWTVQETARVQRRRTVGLGI